MLKKNCLKFECKAIRLFNNRHRKFFVFDSSIDFININFSSWHEPISIFSIYIEQLFSK